MPALDWTAVVAAIITAVALGPLAYYLGGRRERGNRQREFRLLQLDQTLEYVLALSRAAGTVLRLSPSEEPFDQLRAAASLPWRSPLAIPATDEFAELLELSGLYKGSEAPGLVLAMTLEQRQAVLDRIGFLRTLVSHQAAKRREEILRQ